MGPYDIIRLAIAQVYRGLYRVVNRSSLSYFAHGRKITNILEPYHKQYHKHLYSPCRTSSVEHLTRSIAEPQPTRRMPLHPLIPLAPQSLPSKSRRIKSSSLLSLNLTPMRLSLVYQMVKYHFLVFHL
jgi:hypothetical protein